MYIYLDLQVGVVSVLKPYKKWWVLTSLQRNQVLAPRLEGAETSCGATRLPAWPRPRPGRWSRNGTGSGTRRDSGGAGGVGVGGFPRRWLGKTCLPFWLGIYQKVANYICKLYMYCIYLCFPKCNNRFMMSKNISNGSPRKNDGCWDGVGHVFFWVFRSKGRAMFSLTPKNQGFGTHLKLNDTSPWLWGVVVLPVIFFLGGRV